jgi:G:T-mismatch repair DNA endonuclease (very short patch repair protein)/predicted transcriptional regulator
MEQKEINQIINLYKNGLGCVKISKRLGIKKHTVLKVLNEQNLINKTKRCDGLNYKLDGIYYQLDRICPKCNNIITVKSKDKTIGCRNYFNSLNNVCKKCSLDKQKGEGNPFYGKKHSEKSKNKISENRKGKSLGNDNAMSNPIYRKKAIDSITKKWVNGEMEHVRKIMSKTGKENHTLGKIKSIIKSKAELEIKNLVEDLGFDVISSFRVSSKICDIYIPKLNLIIEYNGDYWHCNPKKYNKEFFNRKKNKLAWEIWKYDLLKLELIKELGYNIEVVWESDYKKDKQIIKNIINNYDNRNKNAPERSRQDSDSSTPI